MTPYRFRPWHLLVVLFACEAALGLAYFALTKIGGPQVHSILDLDQEGNVPAWFSSMQLFCIAGVLAVWGPTAFRQIRLPAYLPLLGASVFVFLSLDEAAQIHERVSRAFSDAAFLPTVRNNRGAWVSLYLLAALPFLYLAIRHLPTLWRGYRSLVIGGAIGCALIALGAAGVELIADEFLRGQADTRQWYILSVLAEEMLEMMGGTLLLYGAAHLALPPAQPAYKWKPSPIVAAASAN